MNNRAAQLDAALKAVCPIIGISIGDPADKATWRIDFKAEATAAERIAAAAVLEMFDPDAPIHRDSFLARDLLALLTPDDMTAINGAVGGSPALALLWASLLGQGEAPILFASDRFQAGWAGLAQALGQDRATALMTTLSAAPAA